MTSAKNPTSFMSGSVKKCKQCKREVPCSKWAYSKGGLCTSCNAKKRYAEEHPDYANLLIELKKSTKDELIKKVLAYKGSRGSTNMLFAQKNWQIRNMRLKLLKIRNQIDYLLSHPYSTDTSSKTRLH